MQVKSLRDRTFLSKQSYKGTSLVPAQNSFRPHSYKHWKDLSMIKAVEAVENGTSVHRDSEMLNMPSCILHDRVTGRVMHGCTSGPGWYLTEAEESELVTFLRKCAQIGYPRSRLQVISLVQRAVDKKTAGGETRCVSPERWDRFKSRHANEITLRTPSALSQSRAVASDRASIDAYFNILQSALQENGLVDKPDQILNLDETGMSRK